MARAWCARRARAAHVELDEIRALIVSGRADPQQPGPIQAEQYRLAVEACCALARTFTRAGYDVAIDDVFEPGAVEQYWRAQLDGLDWRLVIVLPTLAEVLRRSGARAKRVLPEHTRAQHGESAKWPARYRIDTTNVSVVESVRLAERVLACG